MRAFRNFVILTFALGVAACAREQAPPPPAYPPPSGAVPPPSRGGAVSAADFVAINGSIDLFVIRSSELALQRSSSPRIRNFASQMIEAHKGTSGQLSFAGRRLNLLPSATLRPAEQAMLDSLRSSSQFDGEYIRDQRSVHRQAVAVDSAYAARGASPTLRPVAVAALPIEQRHLRMIAYL
jgi:predicted outer membrane protein